MAAPRLGAPILGDVRSYPSPRILRRTDRRDGTSWRLHKPVYFIDPYPWIPGTLPEKMVVAELAKRGVPFVFQADWFTEVTSKVEPEKRFALLSIKKIAPDVLLPQHRAVIEVQGEYWHTSPEAMDHDKAKFEVYRAYGFAVIPMMETDIYANVAQQVDRIPGIATGPHGKWRVGENIGLGAGTVAAGNRARARPRAPELRRRVRRGRRRG